MGTLKGAYMRPLKCKKAASKRRPQDRRLKIGKTRQKGLYHMQYETKDEAIRGMIDSEFNTLDADLLLKVIGDGWDYVTIRDNREDDEEDYPDYFPDWPMWGWLWEPRSQHMYCWVEDHIQEVLDCGFTVINYDDGDYEWTWLGIDGAGYDFYEAHWEPLYDALGFKWHKGA